jgi:hypothetical protein
MSVVSLKAVSRVGDDRGDPGAEYITLKADDLNTYCGLNVPTLVLNQDVHFSINMYVVHVHEQSQFVPRAASGDVEPSRQYRVVGERVSGHQRLSLDRRAQYADGRHCRCAGRLSMNL